MDCDLNSDCDPDSNPDWGPGGGLVLMFIYKPYEEAFAHRNLELAMLKAILNKLFSSSASCGAQPSTSAPHSVGKRMGATKVERKPLPIRT